MLRDLSIRVNLKGFRYLQEAVGILAEDEEQGLNKELYAALAKNHNVSIDAVERCIRTAIESGWENRDPACWHRYFPSLGAEPQNRPSNGLFLLELAKRLKLEMSWGRPRK